MLNACGLSRDSLEDFLDNQVTRGSREKKGELLVAVKRTGVRPILRDRTIF